MATRHRKIRRLRGSRTNSWGRIGQHRSAGHKGGRGKAGLGKHHWTISVLLKNKNFPKGFKSPRESPIKRWVNVRELDDLFIKHGKEENGKRVINLKELGYEKLLGSGVIGNAYSIIIDKVSKNAKSKIESAGGEVILAH
jgi:large subunit ribosomal protein L15